MTKTYTGKLISHEFKKKGNTNGRDWEKYLLTFEDGFRATAFDQIRAGSVGKEITVEVENRPWRGDDGVTRESWTIVSARPQRRAQVEKTSDQVLGVLSEIQAQIVGLEAKVDQVLDDLAKRP